MGMTGRRRLVLACLSAAVLAALLVCGLEVRSLLSTSLYEVAERHAAEDAQLLTDLGSEWARHDGVLDARDVRPAAGELRAAQRSHPLTGAAVWDERGHAVLALGDAGRHRAMPELVRGAFVGRALRTGVHPSVPAATVQAAVPIAVGGRPYVVEYHFSRTEIERTLANAAAQLRRHRRGSRGDRAASASGCVRAGAMTARAARAPRERNPGGRCYAVAVSRSAALRTPARFLWVRS
jgi:hypothetical protein